MRLLLHRRVWRAAIVAAIVGFAAAGIAYASIPDSNGLINGCYKKQNGQLRVIDTGAGRACSGSEKPLSWTGATVLFANVNADGTLVDGDATAASRPYGAGTGFYTVTFGQAVSNCAAVATPGAFPGYTFAADNATAGADTESIHPNDVTVRFKRGDTADPIDSAFHLIVVC